MPLARPLLSILAVTAALTVPAAGCGSSNDSDSESSSARERTPTATANSPEAPAGAAARSCKSATAAAGQLRVTGIDCDAGRRVVAGWAGTPACSSPADASRFSCSVEGRRCLGAATARGIVVSCSRPGSSIAFLAKRGRPARPSSKLRATKPRHLE